MLRETDQGEKDYPEMKFRTGGEDRAGAAKRE